MTNIKRFALLGLLAMLLLGGLWLANQKRQQTPAYLLRQYPRTANFDIVMQNHLHPAPAKLFQSDWFSDNTTGSAMCAIALTGAEICTDSNNRIDTTGLFSSLAPAQLARFQTALRALPPGETAAPPLSRLLIVSFRDGQSWHTRLYDRKHPPAQLVRLSEIAGFRGLELKLSSDTRP